MHTQSTLVHTNTLSITDHNIAHTHTHTHTHAHTHTVKLNLNLFHLRKYKETNRRATCSFSAHTRALQTVIRTTVPCTSFCTLHLQLYPVRPSVPCTYYCTLYVLLYLARSTVPCTCYCTLYVLLYLVRATVPCTCYCTLYVSLDYVRPEEDVPQQSILTKRSKVNYFSIPVQRYLDERYEWQEQSDVKKTR